MTRCATSAVALCHSVTKLCAYGYERAAVVPLIRPGGNFVGGCTFGACASSSPVIARIVKAFNFYRHNFSELTDQRRGAVSIMRDSRAKLAGVTAAIAATAAAGYYAYDQYNKRFPRFQEQLAMFKEYEHKMIPARAEMEKLEDDIIKQMHDGLDKQNGSSILMLPTHVLKLPTGEESGSCYALDIGGTNFRVVYYKLSDKHGIVEKSVMRQVAIPKEVYKGSCTQLFDFLAQALVDFIKEQNKAGKNGTAHGPPVVGFCFSFAMEQASLNSGKLLVWTKGFSVDGVIGKDVVHLLSEALVRAGMPCRVLALINDSVGCLAASCYYDQATEMGVILGTGTNACIVMPVSRIAKWQPKGISGDTRTAINTEWGCYCSNLLPRVKEDLELDAASGPQQGRMLIEKLMSGLYMGDCARRLLLSFARHANLFKGHVPEQLAQADSFSTADLCEVESDITPLRWRVAAVMHRACGVQAADLPLETRFMVQYICRLVARRSARLAASLLVSVLRLQNWMEVPRRLVVAVDGGVFLKYNNWRKFLNQYLCEAFGSRCRELLPLLEFTPVADGSSFGAAVIAAAAAHQ